MNVIAFVLAIIAAVIFFVVPDAYTARWGRSGVALGLGFLTVALIVQFCATSHQVNF